MTTAPGNYDEFVVTRDGVTAFVGRFLEAAQTSPEHAAFVQLGVGTVVEGIEMFCLTEPAFRCVLRLAFHESWADEVHAVAQGFHCRRGREGGAGIWYRVDAGEGELEVEVRLPHERYEFLFLPEGDVLYTRFTLGEQ